jgi:hypothetical protein
LEKMIKKQKEWENMQEYLNNFNKGEPWKMSKETASGKWKVKTIDELDGLIKRRHRVRSEFDNSAEWNYHGLFERNKVSYKYNFPNINTITSDKTFLDKLLDMNNTEAKMTASVMDTKVLMPALVTTKTDVIEANKNMSVPDKVEVNAYLNL